jgi:hypothetical protein
LYGVPVYLPVDRASWEVTGREGAPGAELTGPVITKAQKATQRAKLRIIQKYSKHHII